jgi:two-component sensor histidine kinase
MKMISISELQFVTFKQWKSLTIYLVYIVLGLQTDFTSAASKEFYKTGKEYAVAIHRETDSNTVANLLRLNGRLLKTSANQPSDLSPIFLLVSQIADLKKTMTSFQQDMFKKQLEGLEYAAEANSLSRNYEFPNSDLQHLLDFYKKKHISRTQYVFDLLAEKEKQQGNQTRALAYNLKAIKIIEMLKDVNDGDRFYYGAGCTLAELKQYDKALPYLRKAFQILQNKSYPDAYHMVLFTLTITMRHTMGPGKTLIFLKQAIAKQPPVNFSQKKNNASALAGCYMALNQNENAEHQFLEVINLLRLQERSGKINYFQTGLAYIDLSNLYLNQKQFIKAEPFKNRLLKLPSNEIPALSRSFIQRIAFKCDSASGRYFSAINHLLNYKRLSDSIYNVIKIKQAEELQVSYEIEKKNKDLQLQSKNIQLLRKQALLQESKFEQTRSNRNWILLGTLFLLGIGYYRYWLKNKTNCRLQSKQTEISAKNAKLEILLNENEWLLREVHHRVKNNLQIVMSLLSSQRAYLKDEAALNAVLESQHRVQAMSLIHQKLYKANHTTEILMPEYIGDLVDYLKDSFKIKNSVLVTLRIEPISLDISRAVPIGLILNEVITNAFKYAFPNSEEDTITITLSRPEPGAIQLLIVDNGKGFPPDLDPELNQSFGLILIRGLTEDLDGALSVSGKNGTNTSIVFKDLVVHRAS